MSYRNKPHDRINPVAVLIAATIGGIMIVALLIGARVMTTHTLEDHVVLKSGGSEGTAWSPWQQQLDGTSSLARYTTPPVYERVVDGTNVWTLVSQQVTKLHPGAIGIQHDQIVSGMVAHLQSKIDEFPGYVPGVTDLNVVRAGFTFVMTNSSDYISLPFP